MLVDNGAKTVTVVYRRAALTRRVVRMVPMVVLRRRPRGGRASSVDDFDCDTDRST
jgi:hypothetical protein